MLFNLKTKQMFVLIFLISKVSVFSQRNIEKGDRYFNQNQFESAIKYYLLDVNSKNKKAAEKAMPKLADSYRIIGEFEKAEEVYRKILKRKKKAPVNYLNYGLSLKNSAKYAEAKLQFEEYIKLKPEDLIANIYIQSCDSAQLWLDQTIGQEVKNIETINTESSEFSPFVLNNKLYFSSSRKGSTQALISFDGGGDVNRLDIYNIDFDNLENKAVDKTQIVNFKEINSPMHEGTACFSKDGKELYFTKTVKGNRNEKTNDILNTLQIFYSKIDSTGKWTKPQSAFTFNSYKYSVAHPSLSPDGNTIYFMSDMLGGLGKSDIYYSTKQNNKTWSAPKNLGNSVNTFGYEMFPFISESGTLYFSSNAHPGMGQLDVFKANYVDGKWTNVSNMKPPINSIGNDFGIIFDGENHQGFFSSDRFNGKGAEDIYSFSNEIPLKITIHQDTLQFSDKRIFDDLKYKLINENDKSEIELISINGWYKTHLTSSIPYRLVARKNGMLYNKINITFTNNDNKIGVKVKSNLKPIMMSVKLSGNNSQLSNTEVTISDSTEVKKSIKLNSKGEYSILDTLAPSTEYNIQTSSLNTSNNTPNKPDSVTNNSITIKGKITVNSKIKTKANITITENERVISTITSNDNGEFNELLNYNPKHKYSMEVSCEGCQNKIIEIKPNDNKLFHEFEIDLISK